MKLLVVILMISLFYSCGCKVDKVEKVKLPGRYVFTHWNKDTIEIRDNGTYRHFIMLDGKKLENTGTWKLRITRDEILFEDFSFLTDGGPPGNWSPRLRLNGDEIHLMYACDINAYYKRIGDLD